MYLKNKMQMDYETYFLSRLINLFKLGIDNDSISYSIKHHGLLYISMDISHPISNRIPSRDIRMLYKMGYISGCNGQNDR